MSPTITISSGRVLTNWILAVLVGSILLPICIGAPDPVFMAISLAISAVLSLPALGIFFLLNTLLNKRPAYTLRKRLLVHNGIHLLVAAATFITFYASIGINSFADGILLPGIVYTVVGMSIWSYTFIKASKRTEAVL